MINDIYAESSFTEYDTLLSISLSLKKAGLHCRYKGYNRLVYAVYLVLENESRLEAVVKEVYMPVAERFHCSWAAVERSLRIAGDRLWVNSNELFEITGIKLRYPPTPADLLDIFATYIKYGKL